MERTTRVHYSEVLEQLKSFFASPISDPILDGYFVHSVSRFLDLVDNLKSSRPLLGEVSEAEHYEVQQAVQFPEQLGSVEALTRELADYCRGLPLWSHPNAQLNVIPPPTIPSITAFIAAALFNPNIISDEYSVRFAEAEIEATAMLSDLVGYAPDASAGVFTFGGTGTNLYGCKLALEKLFGATTMRRGLREDVQIVASDAAHYSKLNVVGWLGIGTDNLVGIPTTADNEMSLSALETFLRGAFESGQKVACIIATMGTTDAFGIDDLQAIVQLRDRLVAEYALPYRPQVHADAVIGWSWCVFRDYDFEANPLGFHARTLRSLGDSLQRIQWLHLADSIGIDFHKSGYAPYLTSLFLVKRREDLTLLSRQPEQMPYLYQVGQYHPGIYTLECSRSGACALAALANMRLLGKPGYQVLIGHAVEMAEMLRERLAEYPYIQVLNDYNFGPVTLFRVYPPGVDGAEALYRELHDPTCRAQLETHNTYNRRLFDHTHARALRGDGVLLSWTSAYRHAGYAGGGPVSALKSFVMSPWTDRKSIDKVVEQVLAARLAAPSVV